MNIRQIRMEMGLTQWQLAHKAGLSESSIRRAERATQPGEVNMSERSVIKLCRALTISPEEVEQLFDLLLPLFELKGTHEQRNEH